MKHIQKSEEPESFTNWKQQANEDWQPYWDILRNPEKGCLDQSLLQEQGFICCYCNRRIGKENSHIEHLKPRTHYPDLALKYTNLLASCQRERERKEPLHCGAKKDEWYDEHLMVSPLDANCTEFFRYTEDGQILPTEIIDKKDAAKTTIEKLDLNIDKLKNMRSQAIEAILEGFGDLSDAEKQMLLQGFSKPDSNGQYGEFCEAISYIIQQYI
ncbi:MAG: TIGR02646 family protein [Nostocaceae cyanobacterium]|nr:TIGR02646 family protein [Nostocaceae cyanobacterium]